MREHKPLPEFRVDIKDCVDGGTIIILTIQDDVKRIVGWVDKTQEGYTLNNSGAKNKLPTFHSKEEALHFATGYLYGTLNVS